MCPDEHQVAAFRKESYILLEQERMGDVGARRAAIADAYRNMAERAAEVDAKRILLEKTYGVRIDSSTYVRDLVTGSDEVNTRLNSFLAGTERVDTRYLDDGVVEVDVEAPLDGVWEIVKDHADY